MDFDKIDIRYIFGRRLKYIRTKILKVSQEEMSFIVSLNKNYYGDLERGLRNPTLVVLNKIAKGIHFTLQELFIGVYDDIS